MAYNYSVTTIIQLLDALCEKYEFVAAHQSLQDLHDELEIKYKAHKVKVPFSRDYLYKKIHLKCAAKKEKGEARIRLSETIIKFILKDLGYNKITDFESKPLHESLKRCAGKWYSYVRCNSGASDVLRSPVRIYESAKDMHIELSGPVRKFTGILTREANCLYSLLESNSGKKLQLVFRSSEINKPNLLQGVFAGVSAGAEPIAGRELLVRADETQEPLTNAKMKIDEMIASEDDAVRRIGHYFSEEQYCILKAGKSVNFNINDLQLPNTAKKAIPAVREKKAHPLKKVNSKKKR